jgi:hypothetical protein
MNTHAVGSWLYIGLGDATIVGLAADPNRGPTIIDFAAWVARVVVTAPVELELEMNPPESPEKDVTPPLPLANEHAEIPLLGVPHCNTCVPLGPVVGSWSQYAVKLAEFGASQPAVLAVTAKVAVFPGRTITPGFDPTAPAATGPGKFVVVSPVALPVWVKLNEFAASVPVPGTNCIARQPSVEAEACHSVPQLEIIGEDWLAPTKAAVLFLKAKNWLTPVVVVNVDV